MCEIKTSAVSEILKNNLSNYFMIKFTDIIVFFILMFDVKLSEAFVLYLHESMLSAAAT